MRLCYFLSICVFNRYTAANDPCKAIKTFHIMEKFRLSPDQEAFYTLLTALCKHGNVEDAEELMFQNKKLFPMETEGFNIILNGWSNVALDIFEAKRIWREMSKCCIVPNATTYTLMISCFSKFGNLFDSLRLFDDMKKRGWIPGLEVYNSLIYVLTHENCLTEALKILGKIKEMGLQLDSASYNCMIRPLCKAKKLEEARTILAAMIGENLGPTTETYHAFLEGASYEETFEVLKQMRTAGFGPNGDTFLLILDNLFKLDQPENALKVWVEMKQFDVVPGSEHYKVLIEGLTKFGWLVKARELYAEMRSKGFLDDPKLKKLLKDPVEGDSGEREGWMRQGKTDVRLYHGKSSMMRWKRLGNQSRKRPPLVKSNLKL